MRQPGQFLGSTLFLAVLGAINPTHAQEPSGTVPSAQWPPDRPAGFAEQATKKAGSSCWEPPPLPGLKDYDGPMQKTLGIFARPLERNSVRQPRYKPGVMLCSQRVEDKFLLFIENSIDPVTFLSAGFDAATDQASNTDRIFGQGASGYFKRFSAELADRASARFFKDFAYPAIFLEDPRYYPLGQGGISRRLLHATEHLFVAHRSSDGTLMFNYSEWLGTSSSVALSDLYHQGQAHGAGAMARETSYRFAWNVGFDVLREFWPEVSRKFSLPFRNVSQPPDPSMASATGGPMRK